jgi:hypothetical protein
MAVSSGRPIVAFVALWCVACVAAAGKAKNVLFMVVDDGGFENSVWGNPVLPSPNLVALGKTQSCLGLSVCLSLVLSSRTNN